MLSDSVRVFAWFRVAVGSVRADMTKSPVRGSRSGGIEATTTALGLEQWTEYYTAWISGEHAALLIVGEFGFVEGGGVFPARGGKKKKGGLPTGPTPAAP